MAAETPVSFLNGLSSFVRFRPFIDDTTKAFLLNLANDHFCSIALWRWLAKSESEITLNGAQEYSFTPGASIVRVNLIYLTTANGRFRILRPATLLPDTDEFEGDPSVFSYRFDAGTAYLRLWPKPPTTMTGKMVPLSKLAQTRVTTGNLSTASILPHPSEYNHIFSLFLLHYLYQWAQVGDVSQLVHSAGRGQDTRGILAQALAACDIIRPVEAFIYEADGQNVVMS